MSERRRKIVGIVEGHGDAKAVPVLLWGWFRHRKLGNFWTPGEAIRARGSGALKAQYAEHAHLGVEHYVQMAARTRPDGILILLDADNECIEREREGREKLGAELQRRARATVSHIPVAVVIANREYEAWFLAQLDELKADGVARSSMELPDGYDIEAAPGYKAKMEQVLGKRYEETIHQATLTRHLRFTEQAAERSRSFRKLMRELEYLTEAALGRSSER